MNILQSELNEINEKLELLTYRKTQLDAIITEYSDVINRVKNLIGSMQDANVEPSNLLMEIEGLIYCPEPELTPELTPEPQQHFDFDLRLFPKTNSLGLPVATPENLQSETLEPIQENSSNGYKSDSNTINTNQEVCNRYKPDSVSDTTVTNVQNVTPSEPTPEQRGNSLLFQPNIYWDNGSSVRVFIPKKRRYKGELEAIVGDCIEQGLAERYDLNECGTDWIIGLAPVTSEDTVKRIIGEFYPVHTDGEPDTTPEPTPKPSNPELLKIMALVPVVTPDKIQQTETLETSQSNTSSGYKFPDNTINTNQGVCNRHNPDTVSDTTVTNVKNEASTKTQLNERAWRRNDTLLIGFTNKRLMNQWTKWAKDAWGDRVKVDSLETLEGFDHCLSILWFGQADWERLKALDYSLKPTEQNKQEPKPETPQKVSLEDIKAVLKQLHDDGLPAILKGELLAHHFNSLTASELEEHLEKLAEQGLINLGDYSIILKFPEPTNSTDNPTFEYEQVDEKTTKIYADGVLLGLAKDCGSHWESPQFKGQTFPNRRDVVNALWELVNKF